MRISFIIFSLWVTNALAAIKQQKQVKTLSLMVKATVTIKKREILKLTKPQIVLAPNLTMQLQKKPKAHKESLVRIMGWVTTLLYQ